MTGLDLALFGTLVAGSALVTFTFGTDPIIDRLQLPGLPRSQRAGSGSFWAALLPLLGMAAIVFALHALLVTHGFGGLQWPR